MFVQINKQWHIYGYKARMAYLWLQSEDGISMATKRGMRESIEY